MKTQLPRAVSTAALICLASLNHLVADTFTRKDGHVLEGTIDCANEIEVTIKTSDGSYDTVEIASLDQSSASFVQDWTKANPESSGVYSTWDTKPTVVRSRIATTPPQLNAPGFKGIVNLQVILDENGKVSRASVSKSTHDELEDPALEAIRKWSFKPAQVAGKTVKARIAISFKFEA